MKHNVFMSFSSYFILFYIICNILSFVKKNIKVSPNNLQKMLKEVIFFLPTNTLYNGIQ